MEQNIRRHKVDVQSLVKSLLPPVAPQAVSTDRLLRSFVDAERKFRWKHSAPCIPSKLSISELPVDDAPVAGKMEQPGGMHETSGHEEKPRINVEPRKRGTPR